MQPMSLPWFIILLSLTQNPEPFRAHFLFNQQYIAVKIICRIPILHYKSCLLSMIKCAVPKGWHLKPPPRYGAESSTLMPHTESANTSYSPVHTAKATLSHAFGVATCINPHKEKEPGTRIASRLSMVVEAGGIEPPSENTSTQVSPSAVCLLGFPSRTAGKQAMRYGIL